MLDPVLNFAKATIAVPFDAAATAIQLATGQGSRFPDPAVSGSWNGVVWNATDYVDPADDPNVEIVRAITLSGDALIVVRAQEGTVATQKQNLGKIYKLMLGLTAKMIADLSKGALVYTDTTATGTLVDSGDHQTFTASRDVISSVYGLYTLNGQRYSSTLFSISGNQVVLNSPDPDAAAIGLELVYS